MKKMLGLTSALLVAFNISAFAEKIVVTGNPVVLTKSGDYYTVPADFTPTGDYYYVTVDGANKVCYAQEQATLTSLTPTTVTVKVSDNQAKWVCYPYDETYFTTTTVTTP
jgi:hypothetical protein